MSRYTTFDIESVIIGNLYKETRLPVREMLKQQYHDIDRLHTALQTAIIELAYTAPDRSPIFVEYAAELLKEIRR